MKKNSIYLLIIIALVLTVISLTTIWMYFVNTDIMLFKSFSENESQTMSKKNIPNIQKHLNKHLFVIFDDNCDVSKKFLKKLKKSIKKTNFTIPVSFQPNDKDYLFSPNIKNKYYPFIIFKINKKNYEYKGNLDTLLNFENVEKLFEMENDNTIFDIIELQ